LSPSSAHRRILCPGSLAACKLAGVTESEASEYSAEGTVYHDIAARALCYGKSCASYVGQKMKADGFEFTINEDDAAHAQSYVDAIRRLPGRQMYEFRLDLSEPLGIEGQGGTGDAVTLDFEHGTIHVDDLKFGRGEIVHARDNPQLMEYGIGALHAFEMLAEWTHVRVGIHQPRVGHYSEWTYTVEELRAWFADTARPAERRAHELWLSGSADEVAAALLPSDEACRWCPIKGSCAARANYVMGMFPVDPPEQPITMTDDALAAARSQVADIQDWCSAIEAEALRRALAGTKLPGWKIVDGKKGARKWVDEAVALEALTTYLGDKAFKDPEIVTPTEAEKRLKRAAKEKPELADAYSTLAGNIAQADGSKALVPEDDPRVATVVTPVEFALDAPNA
jgi:hypothetical protein